MKSQKVLIEVQDIMQQNGLGKKNLAVETTPLCT